MTGLILGVVLAVVTFAIITTIRSLIIICPPNRVAVISGRSRQLSDGRTVGYRAIRGGRTLRVPLLERVAWMELNTIPIEVSVQNAYSRGAIPLNVQGIANVKVSSIEGLLQNSVERFLDVSQNEIAGIAKETLEANLRGVLATLTPEEVNEDRLKFAQTLIDEADDDIKTLGLELDVLKIQNVTDEVGYLDSVGRRQTAEVLKEARVAEAQRKAEARRPGWWPSRIWRPSECSWRRAAWKPTSWPRPGLTSRRGSWRPRPTPPRSSRKAMPRSRSSSGWCSSTRPPVPTPSGCSC